MRLLRGVDQRPWQMIVAAVSGLLIAITAVGLVGLLVNRNVEQTTQRALGYDVELDDRGDDLRVAILDVRHYQRNIVFAGPTRVGIEEFEQRYDQLHRQIDDLEQLTVQNPNLPQPGEFRSLAREYYDVFRPAIGLYDRSQEDGGAAFSEASDDGLTILSELENMALEIEDYAEDEAETAQQEIQSAVNTEQWVLLLVNGGLIFVGIVLTYAAVRMVREMRNLYAREQRASEALARASRAKTDFLADVSHELRTPLTVLRGNAEVGRELDQDSVHQDIFGDILKESDRMSQMVDDLLFLARSDSDTLPLDKEPVESATLLAELAGRAETLAHKHGADFRSELSGEGPINVDPARIGQAVMVLVDNAVKYGPQGGLVTLSSRTRLSELLIEVSDRGSGIPEKDLPHIFDRFYRVDKARSRKKGGSGLGLSIAATIVQAHGGRIEARSHLGKGTRMTIHLPLSPPRPAPTSKRLKDRSL
ncbi:MAG: sensor histidine kinase [Rubrobacteraceae bacterium]